MTVKNVEKKENSTVIFQVEIDKDAFENAIDKAYKRLKNQLSVPGFRKGKAPRVVLEGRYGAELFHDEAVQILAPEAFEQAAQEAKIDAVGVPSIADYNVDDDKNLTITFTTEVYPEVTLGQYRGLEAEWTEPVVSDEEVDAAIERERKNRARYVDVERPAQLGDTVVLDFEGFVDGVAFEGGKGEHFSLTLGSGQFIPGFEEQVAGHEAGEEFEVNVTFPEQYQAEELAGKAATFKVKLHEVKTKELPAADDEFAKDVSEYDTLDELKASIRKGMEEQNEKNAELEVENDLVEQIVATLEGDIPPVMFETRIDEMVRDFEYRLQQQGLRLEDYIKYMGGDTAKFREGFKEQAEKQVKIRLALEAVAAAEGIAASEEDFENEVKRIADAYKMEVEKVRGIVPEAEVKKDLAVNKAIDFIKQNADVTVENVAPQKDEKAE